jgi:hypothetical protein
VGVLENVAEVVLSRRPGVLGVEANPVAQTATVIYDPSRTSVAELAGWVRDCGYHCAGQSVPEHICDPLAEPPAAAEDLHDHPQTTRQAHTDHASEHDHRHIDHGSRHDHVITGATAEPSPSTPVPDADHAAHSPATPHDAMGHGGHHAGMSMADMVRDMRNRFIVAALLSIPCAQTCTACADACLSEDMVAELTKCIRTDLDCADICSATGAVLSRHTGYDANITKAMLEACRVACASGQAMMQQVRTTTLIN